MTSIEIPAAESVGYPSLQALRLAHRDLLVRFERSSRSGECVDEVLRFLQRGMRTGAVLEEDRERSAGQNILDYWVATLYRLRVEAPVALLAPYAPRERPTLVDAASPYPGLVPFEEENRHFFFGREAVVADICELLGRNRCVVITGASGCGKSSLLRAGILPALKDGNQLPQSADWRYLPPLTPGNRPLEALAELLAREVPEHVPSVAALVGELRTNANRLAQVLGPLGRICLAVDQIESILPEEGGTLEPDSKAFLRNIAALVGTPEASACYVLLVCTDEALTPLSDATVVANTPDTDGPFGNRSHFPVPDLGTRELRDAILEPARQIGLRFEGEPEELVGQLVRTLVGIPAVVPVLQFVMIRLWESRDRSGLVTREDIQTLLYDTQRHRLNAGWALTQAGEAAYTRAGGKTSATGQAMQKLLLRLVAPAPGSGLLLKRISLQHLVCSGDDADTVEAALTLLEGGHLLRRIDAVGSENQHIELVHDALARLWPRLGKWLDAVRVNDLRRERLQQFVDLWLKNPTSEQRLLNDVQLQDVSDLEGLTSSQVEFVRRSRAHVEKRKRQERFDHRLRLVGFATIVVLCLALAVLGLSQWQVESERNGLLVSQAHSDTSRRLIAESRTVAEDTPDVGLLYALDAMRVDGSPASLLGLMSALERNARLSSVVQAPGRVSAVGVSQDGSIVAAATQDEVTLWDAPQFTRRPPVLRAAIPGQDQAEIGLLQFSPDRTRLAAVLNGGYVLVWDVESGDVLGTFKHAQPVASLTFGPTDDQLTTASLDGNVTTWSVSTSAVASQLRVAVPGAAGSALSSDGSMLAAAYCAPPPDVQNLLDKSCPGGIVRVWATATGRLRWQGTLNGDGVVSVAFTPDGTRVISGSADGRLVVWDNAAQLGSVQFQLPGHRNPITSLAVSPDGALLASGDCEPTTTTTIATGGGVIRNCASGDVRIWSLSSGTAIGPVQTQTGGVLNLAFLPNSALLASTRAASLLMWNTALLGTTPAPSATASSGGGIVVPIGNGQFAVGACMARDQATAAIDNKCQQGVLRVQDSNGKLSPDQPPQVHISSITGLAASVDGALVASGGQDGSVLLWDMQSMNPPTWLQLPSSGSTAPQKVSALAFSTGGLLAVNGNDGDVLIWDVQHGNQSNVLPGSTRQTVTALAFSPASGQLVSGAQDGTVTLWSGTGTGATSTVLGVMNDAVQALAVSPDGNIVAAASADQTVSLWDTASGLQIGTPMQSGQVRSLAIDSEGVHITTPDGRAITLWDVDTASTDALTQRACQIAHRNLSSGEWAKADPAGSHASLCTQWPDDN